MSDKSLIFSAALFLLLSSACSRASPMSSVATDSGLFVPPVAPSFGDEASLGEVKVQASAYFSAAKDDSGLTPVEVDEEDKERRRRRGALIWTSSSLMLGAFFSSNSPDAQAPPIVPPIPPGGEVAPVPELSSGLLVLVALSGLAALSTKRKQTQRLLCEGQTDTIERS